MRVKYEQICYRSQTATTTTSSAPTNSSSSNGENVGLNRCCIDNENRLAASKKSTQKHSILCQLLFHKNFKYISAILTVIVVLILYLAGVITFLFEVDFTNYTYPLEINNLQSIIDEIDQHHKGNDRNSRVNYTSMSSTIDYHLIKPLNQFEPIDVLIDIKNRCNKWPTSHIRSVEFKKRISNTLIKDTSKKTYVKNRNESLEDGEDYVRILVVVKSAVNNFHRRDAIRKSWYLNHTHPDGFTFKTLFVTGACHERNYLPSVLPKSWSATDCEHHLHEESRKFNDIIQGSFIDTYYNNTLKTYLTMRWINDNCRHVEYVVAIDDDYFLELENLLKYLKNTTRNHDDVFELPSETMTTLDNTNTTGATNISMNDSQSLQNIVNKNNMIQRLKERANRHLWAGYVRKWVAPLRQLTSKWYISYQDYKFNKFPPFVTGGASLMSRKTIAHFYYATYFTKKFTFDDVYIGLVAYKLDIRPEHSEHFMSPLSDLLETPIYTQDLQRIAVHDIDPDQLIAVWSQRTAAAQSSTLNSSYSNLNSTPSIESESDIISNLKIAPNVSAPTNSLSSPLSN